MLLVILLLLPIAASDAYCDARAFGAAGDGVSDDTAAITAALGACDHVVLRKGSYLSGTAWNQDRFQDYGHSNLDDALILIHDCENVTLRGGGALIVVKSSKNVAIHGSAGEPLRLARGGWITLLLNNASHAVVRHVDVAAARDGVNVISSRHVKLDRLHVRGGSDDAIALKSDWALRRVLPMYDVQVTNSVVRSEKCNGLQIGSETVGNISDILFHNVTVLGAAKAAMSIALAFIVVGARLRRPGIGDAQVVMDEWIGTISDVSINSVLALRVRAERVEGLLLRSTHLDGLAKGRWTSGSKRGTCAAHNDDRPAFVFGGVRGNRLVNSAADRGAASAFDVGLRNAADVAVHGGLKAVDEGAFEVRQRIKPPLNSGLPYPPYFFDT
ncbi:glycosyl hydrolase [Aureococcus anophagefferens]|nr:glycosyl hydrolase [Aureococcus anophagefferens]